MHQPPQQWGPPSPGYGYPPAYYQRPPPRRSNVGCIIGAVLGGFVALFAVTFAVIVARSDTSATPGRASASASVSAKPLSSTEIARGERPHLSAWDGSVACVESYLKPRMNDPDSLSISGCTDPVGDGLYWKTTCAYRGKNKFGALVLNSGVFYIQRDEVVRVEEAQ